MHKKKESLVRTPLEKMAATYFSTEVPEVESRESSLSLPRCRDVGEANKCSIIGDVGLLPGSGTYLPTQQLNYSNIILLLNYPLLFFELIQLSSTQLLSLLLSLPTLKTIPL